MKYRLKRDDDSIVEMTIIDPNTTIDNEIEKYNSFMLNKIVEIVERID